MLFDRRTRTKLLEAGLDAATLRDVEDEVAAEAAATAEAVTDFFGGGPGSDGTVTVYSDMDLTHSSAAYPEHEVAYADLFTHSQDVRGFVRFDTWGAYVEGARVLEGEGEGEREVVELRLGPTVQERVRFARSREALE